MKKLLLLALVFTIINHSFAQTGTLSGSLKSQENKPIESATVYLKKAKDSTLVKIALTDKAGLYEFENIKFGHYFLQAKLSDSSR